NDLRAGRDWQAQLEEVIEKHSTAFAVLLGERGVINWVEREVRLALTRVVSNGRVRYPFILVTEGWRAVRRAEQRAGRSPGQFALLNPLSADAGRPAQPGVADGAREDASERRTKTQ